MTKHNQALKEQLDPLLERITRQKEIIAAARDALRLLVNEVEAIIESVDNAEVEIEDGVNALQRGVDALSEYL